MSKCGKGCMPECEYFTTGGCISPFNCPYKIETGYINTATSVPIYMEQYNGMSDYDIKRLKAENADLHERLKEAEHRAEVAERALATVCEEVLHARYPVEYVTISVVEDFIQLTLKDAEKELAEED